MKKEFTFEYIEQYLEGNLTEEEVRAFKEAMEIDPELAEEVFSHQQAHTAVDMYSQIRTKEEVAAIYKKVKNEKGGFTWQLRPMALAATLLFLVFMGIAYFFVRNNYSGPSLLASSFELYPDRITNMSDEPFDQIKEAMKAYNNQDYDKAIQNFQAVPESNELFDLSRLYLSISYLGNKQADDAIPLLKQLSEKNNSLKEASNWYLALAYLGSGDEENARNILQYIINENAYQSDKANILLNRMNSPLRKLPGI